MSEREAGRTRRGGEHVPLLERDVALLRYVADCWALDYPDSGTPAALRRIATRIAEWESRAHPEGGE